MWKCRSPKDIFFNAWTLFSSGKSATSCSFLKESSILFQSLTSRIAKTISGRSSWQTNGLTKGQSSLVKPYGNTCFSKARWWPQVFFQVLPEGRASVHKGQSTETSDRACWAALKFTEMVQLAGRRECWLIIWSQNILSRKAPRRLVCLCSQLCCCTVGKEEAQFPSDIVVLTSPSPALLWLHGSYRSQRKELPQALSLNLCSTSCTQMTWRSRGRRMVPSESAWTLSESYSLQRGKRQEKQHLPLWPFPP